MVQLTLSAPGLNALNAALMEEVIETLDSAQGAPILLTGEGRAFSAGLNLKEIVDLDVDGLERFLGLLGAACAKLYHYPGPTVAAINGHAIAGGCLLALFCDQRIMTRSPKARMGLNEVALGVGFPPNLMDQIRGQIPRQHIATVLLGGQLFGPEDALRLGLVDRLSDDPLEEGRQLITLLGSHPPEGYRAMKLAIRPAPADPMRDVKLGRALAETWSSPAIQARMQALVR